MKFLLRAALLSTVAASALLASPITVQIIPTVGPSNLASSYAAWTANVIEALKAGAAFAGDSSLPTYYQGQSHGTYSETFKTSYNSWKGDDSPDGAYANEYGNLIVFSAIAASTSGEAFTLSSIGYETKGTGSTILDYDWLDYGPTTSFGTSVVGVINNDDGSKTYVTSGSFASRAVDAVLLRGRGISPTLDCYGCSETERQEKRAAITATLRELSALMMTMTVTQSDLSITTGSGTFTFDDAAVPEPATGLLLGSALIPLLVLRRRRSR